MSANRRYIVNNRLYPSWQCLTSCIGTCQICLHLAQFVVSVSDCMVLSCYCNVYMLVQRARHIINLPCRYCYCNVVARFFVGMVVSLICFDVGIESDE